MIKFSFYFLLIFVSFFKQLYAGDFLHYISLFEKPKYFANFNRFDYTDPFAKEGGTIKFATEGGFNSLNPFLLKGTPAEGLSYLYDTLTEASEDELGVRYALIAEKIKLNNNSIEFKLNQKAYFHDNKPITADDVLFTFETLLKYGHPVYQMHLKQIKKVEVINKYRYNFATIWFDYYRDNNVLIEAFKAQKYDFRQENIARNWATAYDFKNNSNNIVKSEIKHNLPAPMQAFVLNLRREKFQNLGLRKALNYAFDFLWLQQHIFYGSYQKTTSFFTNSDFGYQDFFLPKGSIDGFNRQNLLQAQKILQKSGYKVINNQLLDANLQPVIIEFLIDSKAFEMVVASFVNNLKKLGIATKIKFAEENQYQQLLNNFNFDVIVGVFPQSTMPGAELYGYFHSSQSNIKGGRNLLGLQDKLVDDLVEKIAITTNKNKLIKLCQKLDKYLLENYLVIPHWHNKTYRILYRNIFAMPKIKPKYSLGIDTWFIM